MNVSIDWLSVVLSDDRQEIIDYLVKRLSEVLVVEFQSSGGLHGYEFSKRAEGVVIAYGGESQKNTLLLSMSGIACGVLGWYGTSALIRSLLRFDIKVKFSRIDLALDISGEWWQYFDNPDRVIERLEDGRITNITIVNNYKRQEDVSGLSHNNKWVSCGHTTYVGSRTSERFLRIYRKQKDDLSIVTRFEYELKQRYASVVGGMMVSGSPIGEAYIFANAKHLDISDICDLKELYDEPCLSLPRKKDKSRYQWLLSVSRAIVEFMASNPDEWNVVIAEGLSRSPVGNTGVHIEVPEWLDDINHQALNLETFGTVYHPVPALREYFFS